MRTLFFILKKEFKQIFRNKSLLPFIFVMPIIQLLVLVNAATLETKNIKISIVDNDLSSASRQLSAKFIHSPFYIVSYQGFSIKDAEVQLLKNETDIILHIPIDFERNLVKYNHEKVQFLVNAINGTSAGLASAYSNSIVMDFNKNLVAEWFPVNSHHTENQQITIESSFWYNPELNYKIYMVPAILVLLVTIVGLFLSSMNLVREKELGTIEQINVTPIKKYQFILGKLLPFWFIALFELALGITIGKLFFNVPIVGSLATVFVISGIYMLVVLGMGLFVSTITDTMQQAMFISWFFMLVFTMMSGIFTSTDNMPDWAQTVNLFNPVMHFMRCMRMILLKGSEFKNLTREILALLTLGTLWIGLAVWRYRKTS